MVQFLSILCAPIYFLIASTKYSLSGCLKYYLKMKVSESRGFGEVEGIFWRGIGSLFMVEKIGCKTHCFWKNLIGVRHDHIFEEGNEAK